MWESSPGIKPRSDTLQWGYHHPSLSLFLSLCLATCQVRQLAYTAPLCVSDLIRSPEDHLQCRRVRESLCCTWQNAHACSVHAEQCVPSSSLSGLQPIQISFSKAAKNIKLSAARSAAVCCEWQRWNYCLRTAPVLLSVCSDCLYELKKLNFPKETVFNLQFLQWEWNIERKNMA